MAFVEDFSALIADFGVPCSKGATNFLAVLDQPDDVVGFHAADMISRVYAITYISTAVTLLSGDIILVNGNSFKVQQAQQIEDGAYTQAVLKK